MKEAKVAPVHSGRTREVRLDLHQFLHARLDGTKLTLVVPVHDGRIFEDSYIEYLKERYGEDAMDRMLTKAEEGLLKTEVIHRMMEE